MEPTFNILIDSVTRHYNQLCVMDIAPTGGAIMPSEMAVFLALCIDQGVDFVVESGRKYGYSTECIAKQGFAMVSYETHCQKESDNRLAATYKHASIRNGNGQSGVPNTVMAEWNEHRIAVLLDGPKGEAAIKVQKQCHDYVVMCGIHDMYPKNHLRPTLPDTTIFSDDGEYVQTYGYLDDPWMKHSYKTRGEFCNVTCTLAIIPGKLWQGY
jgi:hypothetical protein